MPIFECSRCNDMTYSSYPGAPPECARCGNATLRVIEGAFPQARQAPRELGPGDHASVVYDDLDSVAPFCARCLTEGIEAGDHVLATLPGDLDEAVRKLLAPQIAAAVEWQTPFDFHGYAALIESEQRTVRIVAGPDRPDLMEPEEFDHYERLAHELVSARGAIVVCLIDERLLPPRFSEIAAQRHGLMVSGSEVRRNEQFEYAPA